MSLASEWLRRLERKLRHITVARGREPPHIAQALAPHLKGAEYTVDVQWGTYSKVMRFRDGSRLLITKTKLSMMPPRAINWQRPRKAPVNVPKPHPPLEGPWYQCPSCSGSGGRSADICPRCGGVGAISHEEMMNRSELYWRPKREEDW